MLNNDIVFDNSGIENKISFNFFSKSTFFGAITETDASLTGCTSSMMRNTFTKSYLLLRRKNINDVVFDKIMNFIEKIGNINLSVDSLKSDDFIRKISNFVNNSAFQGSFDFMWYLKEPQTYIPDSAIYDWNSYVQKLILNGATVTEQNILDINKKTLDKIDQTKSYYNTLLYKRNNSNVYQYNENRGVNGKELYKLTKETFDKLDINKIVKTINFYSETKKEEFVRVTVPYSKVSHNLVYIIHILIRVLINYPKHEKFLKNLVYINEKYNFDWLTTLIYASYTIPIDMYYWFIPTVDTSKGVIPPSSISIINKILEDTNDGKKLVHSPGSYLVSPFLNKNPKIITLYRNIIEQDKEGLDKLLEKSEELIGENYYFPVNLLFRGNNFMYEKVSSDLKHLRQQQLSTIFKEPRNFNVYFKCSNKTKFEKNDLTPYPLFKSNLYDKNNKLIIKDVYLSTFILTISTNFKKE